MAERTTTGVEARGNPPFYFLKYQFQYLVEHPPWFERETSGFGGPIDEVNAIFGASLPILADVPCARLPFLD